MLGVTVWSHAGIICTGETYKSAVKLTFAMGFALRRPFRLSSTPASKAILGVLSISKEDDKIDVVYMLKRAYPRCCGTEHRGTEHVVCRYRSPRPLSEASKDIEGRRETGQMITVRRAPLAQPSH